MLPLTELGHGRQGQPNGGRSEMGKQPLCQDGESKVYRSDVKCSYLLRGTYTEDEGMALYSSKQPSKSDGQPKRQSMRLCSLREWGVCIWTP